MQWNLDLPIQIQEKTALNALESTIFIKDGEGMISESKFKAILIDFLTRVSFWRSGFQKDQPWMTVNQHYCKQVLQNLLKKSEWRHNCDKLLHSLSRQGVSSHHTLAKPVSHNAWSLSLLTQSDRVCVCPFCQDQICGQRNRLLICQEFRENNRCSETSIQRQLHCSDQWKTWWPQCVDPGEMHWKMFVQYSPITALVLFCHSRTSSQHCF